MYINHVNSRKITSVMITFHHTLKFFFFVKKAIPINHGHIIVYDPVTSVTVTEDENYNFKKI